MVANSLLRLVYESFILIIVFLLKKLEVVTHLVNTMTDSYVCILKTNKKEWQKNPLPFCPKTEMMNIQLIVEGLIFILQINFTSLGRQFLDHFKSILIPQKT